MHYVRFLDNAELGEHSILMYLSTQNSDTFALALV